jgi:hypothetical protein
MVHYGVEILLQHGIEMLLQCNVESMPGKPCWQVVKASHDNHPIVSSMMKICYCKQGISQKLYAHMPLDDMKNYSLI